MSGILRRSSSVAEVVSEDPGRVAVMNLDADLPLVLSGTAAVIWSLIDGDHDKQAVLAELEEIYGEDVDGAMSEQLDAFLRELEAQGLLEVAA